MFFGFWQPGETLPGQNMPAKNYADNQQKPPYMKRFVNESKLGVVFINGLYTFIAFLANTL